MMKVKVVRACGERHKQYLGLNYRQITPERYIEKFERGFYFVIEKEETGQPFGWLRYGFFWDSEPFVNMLHIEEKYRGNGFGRQLVTAWENAMRTEQRVTRVMTSSQSDEQAQHFWRRLGYVDAGVLLLSGEAAEIMFVKKLPLQNVDDNS